jgi:hypothetical protein
MKIISIILGCMFMLVACEWFEPKPTEAQEAQIEPLEAPKQESSPLPSQERHQILTTAQAMAKLTPPPDRRRYNILPIWSAGYRYNFNVDTQNLSGLKLFVKRKSHNGYLIKIGWERKTGVIPNFFKYGTIDGVSFDNTGIIFIEQEYKF